MARTVDRLNFAIDVCSKMEHNSRYVLMDEAQG